jgi:hypothetical protein
MEQTYQIHFYENTDKNGSFDHCLEELEIPEIGYEELVRSLVKESFELATNLHKCPNIKFFVASRTYSTFWYGEGINSDGYLMINTMREKSDIS